MCWHLLVRKESLQEVGAGGVGAAVDESCSDVPGEVELKSSLQKQKLCVVYLVLGGLSRY